MFQPIRYLEWIQDRDRSTGDLGTSGLGNRESGIVPPRLEGLPDPPEGASLESQIADRYDAQIGPENVLVTAGTSHANVLAFTAAMGRQEGANPAIAVEKPAYEPLVATPASLGLRVDRLDRDPGEGYALHPESVKRTVGDSTAMAVISNRHNPSGHLLDRHELEALAAASRAQGAPLLVDEVYAPYLPEPRSGPGTAFGGPTAAGLDGAVVTSSLTKFLGFGGLRIGWLIGSEDFVASAATGAAHLPDVAEPSRALARRVFHNVETLVERSRDRIRENTTLLSTFLAETDGMTGPVHPGSTFAFPAVEGVSGHRVSEVARGADLLIVPGRFFEDRERIRLSLSGPPAEMRSAIDQFRDLLETIGVGVGGS